MKLKAGGMIGVIFLLALLPYLQTLSYPFLWDDRVFVVNNRSVADPPPLHHFFLDQRTLTPKKEHHSLIYRPLRTLSYATTHQLLGPSPKGFHLINILFHIGCSLLVFFVATRLGCPPVASFISAAIFAVHPIHTEAIAWISALGDTMASFFSLLAFWLFLQRKKASVWSSVLIIFPLALFSKEMSITFPALLLTWFFWERFIRKSQQPGWIRAAILSSLGISLLYFTLRMNVLGAVGQGSVSLSSIGKGLLHAPKLVGEYLYLFLWPYPLNAFRSTIPDRWAWWLISTLFLALLWWRGRSLRPKLLFGGIAFLLLLAPVLQLLPVSIVLAERFLYLPSVVLCIGVGNLLYFLGTRERLRKGVVAGTLALLVLLAVLTVARNRIWSNEIELFENALAQPDPDGAIYWNLGTAAVHAKDWDRALQAYRNQLKLEGPHRRLLNNISMVQLRREQWEKARSVSQKSITIDPDNAGAHQNLGAALMGLQQYAEARDAFERAVRLEPTNALFLLNLGIAYMARNDLPKAKEHLRRAKEIDPRNRSIDVWLKQLEKRENPL